MATCQELLDNLLLQRAKLVRTMTSGIAEIEQPMLGRTQYRTGEEMQAALQTLDGEIAAVRAACGLTDPAAARKARRPIYPVVSER